MELLIAILIALNSYVFQDGTIRNNGIRSAEDYNQQWIEQNQREIELARHILENELYRATDGGVIVVDGVSV